MIREPNFFARNNLPEDPENIIYSKLSPIELSRLKLTEKGFHISINKYIEVIDSIKSKTYNKITTSPRADIQHYLHSRLFVLISSVPADTLAESLLGKLYIYGLGVPRDIPKGISLLLKSIDKSCVSAAKFLVQSCLRYPEAKKELLRISTAHTQEDSEQPPKTTSSPAEAALHILEQEFAKTYSKLKYISETSEEAFPAKLLKELTELAECIGYAYIDSKFIKSTPQKTKEHFSLCAAINADPRGNLALYCMDTNVSTNDIIEYLQATYETHQFSGTAAEIGMHYLRLHEKNYELALHWLKLASDSGNQHASFAIAKLYHSGEIIDGEVDFAEAAKWYRLSCAQGKHEALKLILQPDFLEGEVKLTIAEKKEAIRKGFKAGNSNAAKWVSGSIRYNNKGDNRKIFNNPRNICWIQLAAQCGCAQSQKYLLDSAIADTKQEHPFLHIALAILYAYGAPEPSFLENNMEKAQQHFLLALQSDVIDNPVAEYIKTTTEMELLEPHAHDLLLGLADLYPEYYCSSTSTFGN